jgi:hypothetical protein
MLGHITYKLAAILKVQQHIIRGLTIALDLEKKEAEERLWSL